MDGFTKVVRIGTLPYSETRAMPVYCKIVWDGGKLSITGVEGPKSNGDALGGCGQIDMHLREPGGLRGYVAAPSWNIGMVRQLLEIWDLHHLNEMKPYDADMMAAGWREKAILPVIGYRFTQNSELGDAKRKAENSAKARLLAGEAVQYSPDELATLQKPYDVTIWRYASEPAPDCPDGYKPGDYKGERQKESKTLGRLKPSEHPDGMLGRKLHNDGPGYGSQWFKHPVPETVLQWLAALPDSDTKPHWI